MTKRRLDLGEAIRPIEQTPEHEPEPKFQAQDSAVIFQALSHATCPDCGQRGMQTSRITGRRTHFHCLACDARFDLDWTAVANGRLNEGVLVERRVTCRLCEGRGCRLVMLPPYNNPSLTQMQKCCDCGGAGRI